MKIYAHRGSQLLWPENTMLAFDRAHEAGAEGFETDLRLSKDDKIVLIHDADLARFGQPEVIVRQHTAAELCTKTIASIDGQFSDHVITLEQLLLKYPQKDYIFDCKISDQKLFEVLKQLLSDLNFTRTFWFLTWSRRADAHVQKLFPENLFFPRAARTRLWGWSRILKLGALLEPKNRALSLPAYYFGVPLFSKKYVQSMHRRGKLFVGYLVNSERDFLRCKLCGVKEILTDRPDLMSRLQ